ncbi:MAG: hypothetical protein V1932_04040 [Chloroflexota bacterium]
MMAKLRKLSLVDAILIIAVVAVTAVTYITSQANANAEQEKSRLELRSQTVEVGLSGTDREATLESLRQRLEQLRSTPITSPLPAKAEAVAITDKVLLYAQENKVTITWWDTSYASITLAAKTYPGIKHSLVVRAETDGLIGFIESLTEVSKAAAIQGIEISGVKEERNMWQMDFELLIYYSEG